MENVNDKWVQLGLKAYAGLYFLILLEKVLILCPTILNYLSV